VHRSFAGKGFTVMTDAPTESRVPTVRGHVRRKALALCLASGLMLSCGDDGISPSGPPAPAGTFALLSTSPAAGGTVALPVGFFDFPQGNGWVQDLTVNIRFTFSESISEASVFIVLWRGSEQCLVAEGLVLGAPYGGPFSYVAGSTITQSGNNFTRTGQCRAGAAGGARSFTTDRLQFVLMDLRRPGESRVVFSQDLAMGWRFE
jgi:hypothetical protein